MTPAEELRAAAANIRAAAADAEPGDWWSYDDIDSVLDTPRNHRACEAADARHITTWSPPVALAVASWLEATAEDVEVVDALAAARGFVTHHPRSGEEWTLARLINASSARSEA